MPRTIHTRPCPTCGAACEVRTTDKGTGKPYWHCDDCIVQVFVRGKVGIQRLEDLLHGRVGQAGGEDPFD